MKIDDDDFRLFGLPERFAVDAGELDARWRRAQAEVHPDRFAAQGAAAQRVAMQWAVRVNEAYRRLKDPLARATYLCELRGAPVEAHSNTVMPGAFLMLQMQWRESLEEADDRAAIERLESEVDGAERTLLAEVASCLDERADASGAAQRVRELMFVRRFRHDIEHRLDKLDA